MNDENRQGSGIGDQGLGATDADRVERDEQQTTDIHKERDEYLQGWKRAKADYENLVREMNQKKSEYADWATEQVLSDLLPALDQYDIAMQFIPSVDALPEDQKKVFKNWIIGLEAVRSLWWDSAKKLGLERVRTDGVFDASMHEAVGEESSETVASGQIIKTVMAGYLLKGKVIRPAKVIVST